MGTASGTGSGGEADAVGAAREWLGQYVDPAVLDALIAPAPAPAAPTPTSSRAPDGGSRNASGRTSAPRIPTADEAEAEDLARTIVLRKLGAQARTREELARALRTKEVPEAAARVVLDRMVEIGLVDDATFAQDWVTSRQQRRHLSRSALRRELRGKGVADEQIDDALSPVGVEDEYGAALSLAQRKHAAMRGLDRQVRYRRLAGVLGRRGFGGEVCARVLAEVLDGGSSPDETVVAYASWGSSAGSVDRDEAVARGEV